MDFCSFGCTQGKSAKSGSNLAKMSCRAGADKFRRNGAHQLRCDRTLIYPPDVRRIYHKFWNCSPHEDADTPFCEVNNAATAIV